MMISEGSKSEGPIIDSVEILHLLFEGITSRLSQVNEIINHEYAETIREAYKKIRSSSDFSTNYNDPWGFIQQVSKILEKDSGYGSFKIEKLGSMGVKLRLKNCASARRIHKRKIIGPVCPKTFFLAMLIRLEFPNKRIRMDYTVYLPEEATTELVFH